jgi:hypothetical protein
MLFFLSSVAARRTSSQRDTRHDVGLERLNRTLTDGLPFILSPRSPAATTLPGAGEPGARPVVGRVEAPPVGLLALVVVDGKITPAGTDGPAMRDEGRQVAPADESEAGAEGLLVEPEGGAVMRTAQD